MSSVSVKYNCYNDCKQSGCPGHIAVVTYHGTSDIYCFDDGKNEENSKRFFDPTELQIFIDSLKKMDTIMIQL